MAYNGIIITAIDEKKSVGGVCVCDVCVCMFMYVGMSVCVCVCQLWHTTGDYLIMYGSRATIDVAPHAFSLLFVVHLYNVGQSVTRSAMKFLVPTFFWLRENYV